MFAESRARFAAHFRDAVHLNRTADRKFQVFSGPQRDDNSGISQLSRQWCLSLHLGGAVRSGITLGQLGSYGFNTFFDVFCSAFEVSRSGFNDEILNTEIGRKFLRLQTFFGVVCGKQLLR